MKKFKIIAVSTLAIVLCLLCITGNTFSWFSRPKSLEGNSLTFSETYNASVNDSDNISFITYGSSDGVTYTDEVTDFSESSGISSGGRKYYRTDIYNYGTDAQSVSLYLQSLTLGDNADGFALGVNDPAKTYKKLKMQSSNELVSTNKMRIYFNPNGKTNWTGSSFTVYYGIGKSPDQSVSLIKLPSGAAYYADIPAEATQVYFRVTGTSESWRRTQTFTDLSIDGQSALSSRVFYITGDYDTNGYNNAQAGVNVIDGANIASYYQSIVLQNGSIFSAGLTANTHYIAKSISYTSSNESIFTVNSSGKISATGLGTAILTTTVTGESYGDTDSVRTIVTVSSSDNQINDVPVVTNVKVKPAVYDEEEGMYDPSVSVYWYIKNDSSAGGMTYTIPELYLTL